jgi:mRNA-degrading endonuclease RelE of RelBE toxin-antitoxin system
MASKTVRVDFTPEFKRNLRALSKKYPRVRSDIEPILIKLQQGAVTGAQIAGTGYPLFKLRIKIVTYLKVNGQGTELSIG